MAAMLAPIDTTFNNELLDLLESRFTDDQWEAMTADERDTATNAAIEDVYAAREAN